VVSNIPEVRKRVNPRLGLAIAYVRSNIVRKRSYSRFPISFLVATRVDSLNCVFHNPDPAQTLENAVSPVSRMMATRPSEKGLVEGKFGRARLVARER
jgi:hypothetical protein